MKTNIAFFCWVIDVFQSFFPWQPSNDDRCSFHRHWPALERCGGPQSKEAEKNWPKLDVVKSFLQIFDVVVDCSGILFLVQCSRHVFAKLQPFSSKIYLNDIKSFGDVSFWQKFFSAFWLWATTLFKCWPMAMKRSTSVVAWLSRKETLKSIYCPTIKPSIGLHSTLREFLAAVFMIRAIQSIARGVVTFSHVKKVVSGNVNS